MGRPPAYNRDTLLRQIVACLWGSGYAGTSISDVVKSTRVNAASLYGLFGSKKGMMLAALDYYADEYRSRLQEVLARGASATHRVSEVLRHALDCAMANPQAKGCFLVNTVLELHPDFPEFSVAVKKAMRDVCGMLESMLQSCVHELRPGLTPAEAAGFLQAQIWALALAARMGDQEKAHAVMRQTMSSLFGEHVFERWNPAGLQAEMPERAVC